MPNQLKMSKIQSIIALRQQGWSLTRIAQRAGDSSADGRPLRTRPFKSRRKSALPARTIQNRHSAYRVGRFKTVDAGSGA